MAEQIIEKGTWQSHLAQKRSKGLNRQVIRRGGVLGSSPSGDSLPHVSGMFIRKKNIYREGNLFSH